MDAVACGWRSVSDKVQLKYSIPENRIYSTNEQIRDAYQNEKNLFKYFRAPFGIIYKSNVVGSLRFDESIKSGGEDIVFNIRFLTKASKVETIDYCGYNCYSNVGSITRSRATAYAASKEHDYMHYRAAKEAALSDWGFGDDFIEKERNSVKARRYFFQISNLMLPGTPYSKRQIREKIREINANKELVGPILERGYRELPLMGKISKFSVQLNNPYLTEIMFYCITKAQGLLGKSVRLSKWFNRLKKR